MKTFELTHEELEDLRVGVTPWHKFHPECRVVKRAYDIKTKDGTIYRQCYPNAGRFMPMFNQEVRIPKEDVVEVRIYHSLYQATRRKMRYYSDELDLDGNPNFYIQESWRREV